MSLKYSAQKVGTAHYVLPRTKGMIVDAHVFLSEDLYASSEESMWNQLVTAASYPSVVGVYCMPDCHAGFGVPIGCVIVTNDVLIQSAAGYDIGCGVVLMKVRGITADKIKEKYDRRRWITEVEKRIALGVGSHRPSLMKRYDDETIEDVLQYGPTALKVDPSTCERLFLPVSEKFDSKKIDRARINASDQLSSLGGGNHMIELECDLNDGSVWVLVHTGSRGYGYKTAEHFFRSGAIKKGIPQNRREDSWLEVDSELGKEYIDYHNSAGNYASANRHAIALAISEATQESFGAECDVFYEISHNLVQRETIVLPDGSTSEGFVHRKGATRAFPFVDDVELPGAGHPCIIPGSMYEGSAVLRPLSRSRLTGFSVNHGSGRVMGRKEAKRRLENDQKLIDDQMSQVVRNFGGTEVVGIVTNSRKTPLDECNEVYKDLDTVLDVLYQEEVAMLERRLYPVANIKGND